MSFKFLYRLSALLILSFALFASGCEDRSVSETGKPPKSLLVFCGAGLRPPVAEIIEAFETATGAQVEADYAGHQDLLSKIKLRGEGDIYVPGDKHYVDLAAKEGMILSQLPVCYFVPTILVQKGNPKAIHSLQDLLAPGIRLGLGNPRACAIGKKSKKLFEKNLIPWQEVERNLCFLSATVNELGMQIQAQSLDAVIVWDAIAKYYEPHGDEVQIPPQRNVTSTVDAGILKFTRNKPLAEEFIKFMSSGSGREIFRKHGYRVDRPEGTSDTQ